MRKALAVAAVAALATVGFAGTAQAAPEKKEASEWVCEGQETLIIEAGRNGWVDGEKYHAIVIEFSGTFTPTGGTPETETFSKTYGGGKGLNSPDAITCTQDFSESGEEGSFVGSGFVVAVPA